MSFSPTHFYKVKTQLHLQPNSELLCWLATERVPQLDKNVIISKSIFTLNNILAKKTIRKSNSCLDIEAVVLSGKVAAQLTP